VIYYVQLSDGGIDMFHLWSLAEQDLLSDSISYRLRDTGQGLNRVQAAPKTSRLMHVILNRAQKSIGSWVGSSVIHMGDHNVPNALMFIGKSFPMTPMPSAVSLTDMIRQVFSNISHLIANLQYSIQNTQSCGVPSASILHGRRVWVSRQRLSDHSRRFLPSWIRWIRCVITYG
jgi:hypothetical protein